MIFFKEASDAATLKELGSRIAQYRLNRNLTQGALAQEAGISLRTLHRVEHGESTHVTNMIRVLRVLGLLENLEALIPEPTGSPIQQMRMRGKNRRRASSPTQEPESPAPWSWEDEK